METAQQSFELDLTPTCPLCSGPMAKRTSQYGEFWSCQRYPTCRGKRSGSGFEVPQSPRPTAPAPASIQGSPEQEEIWRVLQQDDCHVVVKALAGTGKSFTCRHAMRLLPTNLRILYLAFNREIVQEFSRDAPRNAEIRTLNAKGFQVVKRAFPDIVLDPDKVRNILEEIAPPANPQELFSHRSLLKAVESLVALCQGYLIDGSDPEQLLDLAARHEIELDSDVVDQVLQLVPTALRLDRERTGVVSYNDQLWLPVVLNLPCPKYDVIFVDEAQDLNTVQHHLLLKLLAPGGRVVVVGDDHQAIYGFRGSDVESINNLTAMLQRTGKPIRTLPLTVTRRCSQQVTAQAQAYVPALQALPDAPDGQVQAVSDSQAEALYQPGDMVLCRCNAPLVGVAFRLIKRGVKAVIRGRDIGQGLVTLIQKLRAQDINDLLRKLDGWQQVECSKLVGTRREEQMVQQIVDRADCIRAMAEDCDTVLDLVARISALFENFSQDGAPRSAVVLSSIHRAKGLEAERVFWLFPEISCRSAQAWQQQQEINLRYVAITRAKTRLVMVLEESRPTAPPVLVPQPEPVTHYTEIPADADDWF